ncbi:hypothetical protein ACF9IK_00085 [Kitasatospora hibisci]|uniref:hypothetical protein n=1 Tax=Kitasatospora hibisci TaxID=3369522 RepID=UPI00375496A8
MHEHLDALEKRMQQLQHAMRQALAHHDNDQVNALRQELRRTQNAWDALFSPAEEPPPAHRAPEAPAAAGNVERQLGVPTAREQVRQALTLLTVPAAPKLLSQVHQAFFFHPLNTARLATLRRDEERSFRATPDRRSFYICPALACDRLSPVRALLALSTWPLEQRLVGPLTARVNFLTSALRLADAAEQLPGGTWPLPVQQLLLYYNRNIPGCPDTRGQVDLDALREAAAAELAIHADDDADTRAEASRRALTTLDATDQIFGAPLHDAKRQRRIS